MSQQVDNLPWPLTRVIHRRHDTLKAYVHDWLEPDGPHVNFFSGVIIGLVLISLAALALETEALRSDTPFPSSARPTIQIVNYIVVWAFATEFALRFWSEGENPAHAGWRGRLRFLLQPITIFDLLAFLPELIVLLFFPHVDRDWLAALRALRIFRLAKLARYVPAFSIVGAAVKRAGGPLLASACVAAAQVYIAALILYFIEGDTKPQAFGSITRALWWAVVTLTTVGYGDVYPDSVLGRIAAGLVAVAGIGIVAMPTGILASSFAEEFRERYEKKQHERANTVQPGGDSE